MIKIAMTGGRGMIGKYLAKHGVIDLDCDVTKPWEIDDRVSTFNPDVIVHLAGKSNIDYCEKPENKDTVIAINLRGTYNLLTVAEKYGNIPVVMISSDHVFDGGKGFLHKRGPYKETDKPNPINFYGKSRLATEGLLDAFSNFKVIRTSYLFDKERLASQVESYPDFICRSFMYIGHFVDNLFHYVYNVEKMPPLLHISGSKTVSWHKFMSDYGRNVSKRKKELEDIAPRPHHAGLTTSYKLFPSRSYLDGFREIGNV